MSPCTWFVLFSFQRALSFATTILVYHPTTPPVNTFSNFFYIFFKIMVFKLVVDITYLCGRSINLHSISFLNAQKNALSDIFLFLFLFILFEFSFISPDIMSWTNLCHFWFINRIIVLFRIVDLQDFFTL